MSFVEYSNMFLLQHLDGYFNYVIPLVFPGTSPELTQYAAPLYRNAVMAHFAGDEKISPDQQRKIDSLPNTMLKVGVTSFWTDLGIKVTLHIEGMSCGHCLNAVNRALAGLPGLEIESVKIGRADVVYDEHTLDPSRIEAAVTDAGYRATGAP